MSAYYLDDECGQSGCHMQAIEQLRYDDSLLCEDHFRDNILWDEADRLNQMRWEEQ